MLFLVKNLLWVTSSLKGSQSGIWGPICSDMGADFPGWVALETPLELPETLSRALLDPLGSWSLVPGPWSLVPGPWSLVRGPWSLGPWSLVPGTICLDLGTLFCYECGVLEV